MSQVQSTYNKLLVKKLNTKRYLVWVYNAMAVCRDDKELMRLGRKADDLEDKLAALNYTIELEKKKHLELLSFAHIMEKYFGTQVTEINGTYYINF